MLLRASGAIAGKVLDVHAVTSDAAAATSGVAHADAFLALADAMVGTDDDALTRARNDILERLGPQQLVDAAAVASNFERMVRIADATGIPLDGPLDVMSEDLRQELGINRFGAAASTPAPGLGRRAAGRLFRPMVFGALRLVGRIRSARAR